MPKMELAHSVSLPCRMRVIMATILQRRAMTSSVSAPGFRVGRASFQSSARLRTPSQGVGRTTATVRRGGASSEQPLGGQVPLILRPPPLRAAACHCVPPASAAWLSFQTVPLLTGSSPSPRHGMQKPRQGARPRADVGMRHPLPACPAFPFAGSKVAVRCYQNTVNLQ